MMLVNTFLETRLAVGRLGCIRVYGIVLPTVTCQCNAEGLNNRHLTRYRNRYDYEKVNVEKLSEWHELVIANMSISRLT